MTNVYKMKLFRWPGLKNSEIYVKYCLTEHYLGWGWPDKTERQLKRIVTNLKDYYCESHLDADHFDNLSGLKTALKRAELLSTGDYVWTYGTEDGEKWSWYLGKVTEDTFTCGNCQIKDCPEIGMLKKCEWKRIEYDDVPGEVASFCRADGTIRKLNSEFLNYCQWLYDNRKESSPNINFWKLAHPDDLEDLVGIYLQKNGYYIFPSTNKQGTKDYEFKLIRSDGKQEAIIQCKNNANIPLDDLEKTYSKEEIYILGIKDNNKPKYTKAWKMGWQSKDGRIKIFDAQKIETWARDNKSILPKRIQKFLELSKHPE